MMLITMRNVHLNGAVIGTSQAYHRTILSHKQALVIHVAGYLIMGDVDCDLCRTDVTPHSGDVKVKSP